MTITIDFKKGIIESRQKSLLGKLDRAVQRMANNQKALIVLRTRSGKDVDGRPFARYTEKYREKRIAAGRSPSPVDLTFTGEMLRSIQIKKSSRGKAIRIRQLGFPAGGGIAGRAGPRTKALGLSKKRKFFGVSDKDRKQLAAVLLNELRKR